MYVLCMKPCQCMDTSLSKQSKGYWIFHPCLTPPFVSGNNDLQELIIGCFRVTTHVRVHMCMTLSENKVTLHNYIAHA